MGGDSEYEPKDSRNVTRAKTEGEASTPDGRWTDNDGPRGHGGQYEPRDSRNVTGTATTSDGRWTNRDGRPPLANGDIEEPAGRSAEDDEEDYDDENRDEDGDDTLIAFEPDPELSARIRRNQAH